ncbi:MAG: precorrin-2 C(20)-methyltransferase [Dongiaceae bacterium]
MSAPDSASGTVWGIGVGPGDPELLTLKALRLIRAAPVLAYPAPETGDSFARGIAAPHLPGGQTEIAIRMPIGDGAFPKADIYDAAADVIAGHAAAGRDVAVLCEGDPFFYGSFMYLYARLAGRCPVRIVPGVSSLMACADAAGTPLAARNDVLTVIPAPLPEPELRRRLADCEAAAVVKLGRHLGKLKRVLAGLDLVSRTRYVERATLGNERVLPLAGLPEDAAPYFSMLLVHKRGEAWR